MPVKTVLYRPCMVQVLSKKIMEDYWPPGLAAAARVVKMWCCGVPTFYPVAKAGARHAALSARQRHGQHWAATSRLSGIPYWCVAYKASCGFITSRCLWVAGQVHRSMRYARLMMVSAGMHHDA